MTEQEIIEYLKENKNKGVAYLFLPEQVRDWIHDKLFDKILLVLDSMGNFIPFDDVEEGLINTEDYDNIVFALSDDYKVKQESKGEWVEFTITDGVFTAKIECDEGESYTEDFHWWDWQGFLTKSFDYDMNYTAFGGWQYPNHKTWLMNSHVYFSNTGSYWSSYTDDDDTKPAIPCKIRFWREA